MSKIHGGTYVPAAPLMAKTSETADQKWLREQAERIDPHLYEMGNDMGYTRALEKLALEQRAELERRA